MPEMRVGPIYSDADAQRLIAELRKKHPNVIFTGHWWTIVTGEVSVLQYEFAEGFAAQQWDKRAATHITREANVESILRAGLDPHHGGRGGASETVPGSMGQHFIDHSSGKVHLTFPRDLVTNATSDHGRFYEDHYEGEGIPHKKLYVLPRGSTRFEKDPDDDAPGRARTTREIPADRIWDCNFGNCPPSTQAEIERKLKEDKIGSVRRDVLYRK